MSPYQLAAILTIAQWKRFKTISFVVNHSEILLVTLGVAFGERPQKPNRIDLNLLFWLLNFNQCGLHAIRPHQFAVIGVNGNGTRQMVTGYWLLWAVQFTIMSWKRAICVRAVRN